MRVVLATRHAHETFIPLALRCLEASLLAHGCSPADVRVLEFARGSTAEAIARAIASEAPDIVGLSCYVWNVTALLDATRIIRERLPRARIVLGGPEAGPAALELMTAHQHLDAVVRSEGEMPLAALVQAWTAGRSAGRVPGIVVREDGRIVDTGPAPLVDDMSVYPSPHLGVKPNYDGRVVCVETQRGCVFQCNFCFYNKDYTVRNRRFPLDRVKAELLVALEQDPLEIFLMDPIFNLNAARAKEICRFIAQHNPRRIPIHSEIWAEFVDEELASLMRDAAFQMLEVGLQTTNETALAAAERRLREQRFLDGIRHLHAFGLRFELHLIYGLPGETRETFRRSLNYGLALDPTNLSIFRLMALPGTELRRKAAASGLVYDPEPPYHVRSHASMSEADVEYGHRMLKAANLLQESRTVRLLSREPGLPFAEVVDAWLVWRPENHFDTESDAVQQFVDHLCRQRGIPPDFYRHFSALELSAPEAAPRRG